MSRKVFLKNRNIFVLTNTTSLKLARVSIEAPFGEVGYESRQMTYWLVVDFMRIYAESSELSVFVY